MQCSDQAWGKTVTHLSCGHERHGLFIPDRDLQTHLSMKKKTRASLKLQLKEHIKAKQTQEF